MNSIILIYLVVMTCSILVECPPRIANTLDRPHGPKMCCQLCKKLVTSVHLVHEFRCRRAFISTVNSTEYHIIGGSLICLENLGMTNNHTTERRRRLDSCIFKYKGKDPSDLLNGANFKTALHRSCRTGKFCTVHYIISNGLADINCRGKYNRTPVMIAARHAQQEVFDFLVSQRCELLLVDTTNDSVLHMACKGGNIVIVRELLALHFFDVNSRGYLGRSPFMHAVYHGHRQVANFLLSKGCNLQDTDEDGNNILHIACQGGNVPMVSYILALNVISMEGEGYLDRTPVLTAVEFGKKAVVEFLVSKACNLNVTDSQGNSILHLAFFSGNADLVKYVVTFGVVDKEKKNIFGMTPSEMANLKKR